MTSAAPGNSAPAQRLKSELAAELAAVLAFSAIKNNDKVGLIIFTDRIEKFIPPEKGRNHVWRVIREVLEYRPRSKKTDISAALDFLNRITSRKVIAFLISDFISGGYEKLLRMTNKKHDLIAIAIADPRERDLPAVGLDGTRRRRDRRDRLIYTGEPHSAGSSARARRAGRAKPASSSAAAAWTTSRSLPISLTSMRS